MLTADLGGISKRAPVTGKNIKRTLENSSSLTIGRFETHQDDPMFHQLSVKFDQPGYSGLMCTFLEKSQSGRFELFPDPQPAPPCTPDAFVSDAQFEQFFQNKSKIYKRMRSRTLCPMLEQYRGHFQDQSLYFQGTRSVLPGERTVRPSALREAEFKTNDRVLDGLEQSLLSNPDFGQTSLIEEFENAPSFVEADQDAHALDEFDDYQVENFSEKKRLQLELMDNQSQSASGSQFSRVSPLTEAAPVQVNLESNLFSREFEYWACLEPEKWRFKAKRIKSSRKRLRTKKKKQLLEEQFLKHFELVFTEQKPFESKNVIHIMKQALVIQIECDDIDLGRVDPLIPMHPNSDLSSLLSHPVLCYQARQSLSLDGPTQPEMPPHVSVDPTADAGSDQLIEEMGFSGQMEQDGVVDQFVSDALMEEQSAYPLIKIPSENTLDISKVVLIAVRSKFDSTCAASKDSRTEKGYSEIRSGPASKEHFHWSK